MHRILLLLLLVVAAWTALAAWQYREYGRECEAARQTLDRQAESIMTALVGGIRSHRRMGRFFQEQLQGALEELAAAKDVLAVAITTEEGTPVLSAGEIERLSTASETAPASPGPTPAARFTRDFEVESDSGEGRGRGWGRGMYGLGSADEESPFSEGGRFRAVLLLDRTQFDAQCRRAFWLRLWTVVAGGLVIVFVGLAWLATVRLAEARGRQRVLEAEARHLRDLGQAAAGLAHETRNPLGLIRGWMQRLAQSDLAPEQKHQTRAVVEECDRIAARINQFLAFARPTEPKLETVELGRLLGELSVLLEPDLEARGVTLERRLPEPPPVVRADREMLRQALFNLVWNAIHFTAEKGVVEIAVRSGEDETWRIEVADRGPGVAPEKVAALFTPYFTTRPEGTGLGLAIVRRIAAAHGWSAGYTPRPGSGSVFWLDRMHA